MKRKKYKNHIILLTIGAVCTALFLLFLILFNITNNSVYLFLWLSFFVIGPILLMIGLPNLILAVKFNKVNSDEINAYEALMKTSSEDEKRCLFSVQYSLTCIKCGNEFNYRPVDIHNRSDILVNFDNISSKYKRIPNGCVHCIYCGELNAHTGKLISRELNFQRVYFIRCSKCGYANPTDHIYCGKCGSKISKTVTQKD